MRHKRINARGLALAGGWLAVVLGAAHLVVAPLDQRTQAVWADALERGPWAAISLSITTAEDLERSEAFWFWPGSFAVPMVLLGALVVWITRRGERLPALLGWTVTAWAIVSVVLLPASPIWALLLIGLLLVAAAYAPGPTPEPDPVVGVAAPATTTRQHRRR